MDTQTKQNINVPLHAFILHTQTTSFIFISNVQICTLYTIHVNLKCTLCTLHVNLTREIMPP